MLPEDVAGLVDRVRRHYDDGCFACGRANSLGLQIDGFGLDGVDVEAWFLPRDDYRGIPGWLHGGVAATAVDEILAWACILTEGVLPVTATLDLRFRRPTRPGVRYRLRGRVDGRSGKRLRASGALLQDDEPVVLGRGLYVAAKNVDELLGPAGGAR